ncbi:hypothetical protein HY416_01875 [Candidatus Kaiserbacteria bacterium]|nr:hypothetical protein [Candidatus Kaiserbacteria bacterium]
MVTDKGSTMTSADVERLEVLSALLNALAAQPRMWGALLECASRVLAYDPENFIAFASIQAACLELLDKDFDNMTLPRAKELIAQAARANRVLRVSDIR